MDGSKTINLKEFKTSGFLFNLKGSDFKKILNLFDITGDEVQMSYNYQCCLTVKYLTAFNITVQSSRIINICNQILH